MSDSAPVTLRSARRTVTLTIDGESVTVPEGTTILDAAASMGERQPTLCYLETLHPVNACRVCVVEVENSRVLVPACSRKVENGMVVKTNTDRVKHSRKMVLEFLASSVDLSTTPDVAGWIAEYDAKPERYGPPAPARPRRATPHRRGIMRHPIPHTPQRCGRPEKIDNDLYMRDYSKCILCYKCVEACGTVTKTPSRLPWPGRGFDASISTEFAIPLPDSACVFHCGNCIAVCPTGALMFSSEHDRRVAGKAGRGQADADRYDLSVLRCWVHAHFARPGQ